MEERPWWPLVFMQQSRKAQQTSEGASFASRIETLQALSPLCLSFVYAPCSEKSAASEARRALLCERVEPFSHIFALEVGQDTEQFHLEARTQVDLPALIDQALSQASGLKTLAGISCLTSLRSAPAQKARPFPVRVTTLISASASMSSHAVHSSCSILLLTAFIWSGRFKTIRATFSDWSHVMQENGIGPRSYFRLCIFRREQIEGRGGSSSTPRATH